jgi:hypothetical protein
MSLTDASVVNCTNGVFDVFWCQALGYNGGIWKWSTSLRSLCESIKFDVTISLLIVDVTMHGADI